MEMKNFMKLFKYCLYLSIFFCSCADATPKEKINDLACPYVLPAEKDFPVSWITLGKVSNERLQLRQINIIDGNASEEKDRVIKDKERMFSVEITDYWVDHKDRSEALEEYSEDHSENAIMCTYGKTIAESNDVNKNVVLLIPLPIKKPVTCLLVRRDVDPTHEISCKVK